MISWLTRPLVAGLALSLAASLVAGAIWWNGRNSLKPELHKAKAEIVKLKSDRDGWRVAFNQSENNRKAEQTEFQLALTSVRSACDAEVKSARKSQAALDRVLAKPVKYDKANCPIRTLVTTPELASILTPGVR